MLSRRRTARKDVYYGEKIDFNISLHAPTLPIQPPCVKTKPDSDFTVKSQYVKFTDEVPGACEVRSPRPPK